MSRHLRLSPACQHELSVIHVNRVEVTCSAGTFFGTLHLSYVTVPAHSRLAVARNGRMFRLVELGEYLPVVRSSGCRILRSIDLFRDCRSGR